MNMERQYLQQMRNPMGKPVQVLVHDISETVTTAKLYVWSVIEPRPDETHMIQVSWHYRDGQYCLSLKAFGVTGQVTEKTRARLVDNPLNHDSLLAMYERQSGNRVDRKTRRESRNSPPWGMFTYQILKR